VFSAPPDHKLDRAGYFARCWPGAVPALADERRSGRGRSSRPGIAPSRPRGRAGRLRQERRLPATLSVEQVAAIPRRTDAAARSVSVRVAGGDCEENSRFKTELAIVYGQQRRASNA